MRIGIRHWMLSLGLAGTLHAAMLLGVGLGAPVPIGSGGGVRIALGDAMGAPEAGPSAEEAPVPEPLPPAAPSPPPEPPARAGKPAPAPKPHAATPLPEPAPPVAEAPATNASQPDTAAAGAPAGPPRPDRAAASAGPPGQGDPGRQDPGERGLEGLDPEYVRQFMARLERYKQYPRAARAHQQEGITLLWLRVDREGRVLAYEVEESSGHRLLDRAVLRAIERANPMPPLPTSFPRAELEVVVPIAFRLQ